SDGSMDEIKDLPVKIISFSRNRGGGTARLIGMRHARGNIIVQTDADGTYPLDAIGEMLDLMKTADLVIGARKKESAKKFYFLRIFMKWFIKKIAELLVNQKIPDLNSGLRVYKRKIALKYAYLYPAGHSIMSTMTLAFMSEGYVVKFVAVDYLKRIGSTSFNIFRDTTLYLITTLTTIVYFNPLKILLPLSFFISFLAFLSTVRDLLRLAFGPVTIMLWLLVVLLMILGLISEQIRRVAKLIASDCDER
ncbi:MAG: glycosyltransferase family 2 protein, partial [Elusimicrobiales bacterium]|nr:glycosyltransferase family 2 protein [Elusimicrobiales bacterium]